MSQKNSLSSFQYDDTAMIGRYPNVTPVPLPITASSSGSLLEQSLPATPVDIWQLYPDAVINENRSAHFSFWSFA